MNNDKGDRMDLTKEMISTSTGEIIEQPNRLVFGTQEPEQIINRATAVANRLVDIVEKGRLYNNIQGKKFVRAEGWTAMAAMLGVFPTTDYCRRLDREGETVYEAKVILRHLSGQEVGSGEAMCSSKEKNWSGRDEYAVKSMAQTRAVGKACRLSFSWIMSLAGYEACNAEEISNETQRPTIQMPRAKSVSSGENRGNDPDAGRPRLDPSPFKEVSESTAPPEPEIEFPSESPEVKEIVDQWHDPKSSAASPPEGKNKTITSKQQKFLFAKWKSAGLTEALVKKFMKDNFNGLEHTSDLTMSQLDTMIGWIDRYEELNAGVHK